MATDHPARYYPADAARARSVRIRLEADALVILDGSNADAWPKASIRRTPGPKREVWLAPDATAQTRLCVTGDAAQALAFWSAAIFQPPAPKKDLRTALGLGLAVIFAAGWVIWGLSALAGPLARTTPPAWETALGERALRDLAPLTRTCQLSGPARAAFDGLVARLATAAEPPFPLDARIAWLKTANAFAVPGGGLVVSAELLALMESPDELAGFLAHEIAHIADRHAMAGVIKRMGLGVLSAVFGGGSSDIATAAAAQLTAASYSRGAERRADALALDYLDAAGLDPGGLADFFDRLEALDRSDAAPVIGRLLASHPDREIRAERARRRAAPDRPDALTHAQWRALKAACPERDAPKT
ncbi:MAG: M48 family metallopeptidase [Maricaulaceae bacterium]